jgi:hypothetical protein
MTILDRHYETLPKVGLFCLDRSARLLPQYVLYLLFALSALALTRNSSLQGCGAYEIGLNLIIFPLDLYQSIDLKRMLIPQVWSLGLVCSCPISDYLSTAHQVGSPRINRHFLPIGVFFGTIDSELYLYRLLPHKHSSCFLSASRCHGQICHMPTTIWLGAACAVHRVTSQQSSVPL